MVETDDLEVNSPDATSTSLDLENLKNGDAADTSLLAETEAHLDSSRSTSGALVVVEVLGASRLFPSSPDSSGQLHYRRSNLDIRKAHFSSKDLDPTAPIQPEYFTCISSVAHVEQSRYFRKRGRGGEWHAVDSPQSDPVIRSAQPIGGPMCERGENRGRAMRQRQRQS
eukprot:1378584-Rhodomonas_salina.1